MPTNVEPLRTPPTGPEELTPAIASIRSAFDGMNPAGVTPAILGRWLAAARGGDDRDLQDYAETVLERDGHARALLSARVDSMVGPDHIVEPASQEPADLEIAEAVRQHLVDAQWWQRARHHLAWAVYYGYSVGELVWTPGPTHWAVEFSERPNRWFVWDQERGRELYLRDNRVTPHPVGRVTPGIPIEPGKVCVHTAGGKPGLAMRAGLLWPIASLHMIKSYVLRSWADLAEKHGHPMFMGHAPQNADRTATATFRRQLANVRRQVVTYLPPGFKLDVLDAKGEGHADFHRNLLDYIDKTLSKIIRHQTMTSEDGSSRAQASVHKDVAREQTVSDASAIDTTMSCQIIKPWCEVHYGERPFGWPRVVTDVREEEDAGMVAKAYKDVSEALGGPLPVRVGELRQRLGFAEPEDGDELPADLFEREIPVAVDRGDDVGGDIDRNGESVAPGDDARP